MGVTIVHSGDHALVGLRFLEHRSLCFREKNCILLRVDDATLGCTKFLVNDRRSFRLQWSHYYANLSYYSEIIARGRCFALVMFLGFDWIRSKHRFSSEDKLCYHESFGSTPFLDST